MAVSLPIPSSKSNASSPGKAPRRRPGALQTGLLALALLTTVGQAHAEWSVTRGSQNAAQPMASSGAPAAEWVYTLKSGEQISTLAAELLTDSHSASELLSYNRVSENAVFREGDTIRIPLAWLKQQPDPATAVSVSGSVRVISGIDGRQRPLVKDTLVRVGDEIVSRTGNATIRLADGSVIRVNPNSRLIFNKLTQYGKAGMVDTRLRLDHGAINTQVTPLVEGGARFEVETPSAVAAVRGTTFALQARPGATNLQVTEGMVTFGPPGQTRNVPSGYSATVDTSAPGEVNIFRLPPAPEPHSLPPRLESLPAELSWTTDGDLRHRVDIFSDEDGQWIKSDIVNGNRYALDYLDNGSYQIQVAALDSRGIAGMPAALNVDIDLEARAAMLSAPQSGAEVDDDMPEFQWSYQGENEVARVEISDTDDFANVIASSEWAPDNTALPSRPLRPGQYYWRVVTEAGGNSVATSEARPLIINGTLPPVQILSVNYLDSQVRIFWKATDTATGYLLQLSEGPEFRNIVKEATVDDTTAALRLIPGRRYFVRLKALSDGPLASRWGPGRELFIE